MQNDQAYVGNAFQYYSPCLWLTAQLSKRIEADTSPIQKGECCKSGNEIANENNQVNCR